MMLGVPVPNGSLYLSQEVEAALLGQVSEVANQVCDSTLVASAAVLLEDGHRVGGLGYVSGFVDHAHNPEPEEREAIGKPPEI